MKDFIKYTLATVTGLVIVGVVLTVLSIVTIVGIVASTDATTIVADNSVMTIELKGVMTERNEENPLNTLMGNDEGTISLEDMLKAIDMAKADKNIKGIYIEAGAFSAGSPASAQELRNKLAEFKKAGKWIISYGDQYTQTAYYICSVSNKVLLNPIGTVDWRGLAAQPYFLKDLMAKFGVKMQLVKVGKYKSAPEMYTEDKMSEPNREQVSAYINGIWNEMVKAVSESRKISTTELNRIADSGITFADSKEYLKTKMVDELVYTGDIKKRIKKQLGIKEDETINQLSVSEMLKAPAEENTADEKIAVYYAYGDIVDEVAAGFNNETCIVGSVVTKDLEELANDDDIKAVVLRVNSGGGSAYASEQMWNAVKELKKKKPVVVSMGGMAASGGYYMSCGANYIFAEPTTITGSIGIFGMIPDMSGLITDKLGVKFDEVKTNKFSAFGSPARPFNAEEIALLQTNVNRGYNLFLKRVAQGRKMTTAQVNERAQGRVWIGKDAIKQKLVDAMGSTDDAVKKAAELAKIKDYNVESYPANPSWIDNILETAQGGNYLDEQLKATLGDYYQPFMMMKSLNKQNAIQARMTYDIIIR